MTVDLNVDRAQRSKPKTHAKGEYKRYLDTKDGISPLLFPPSKEIIKWNSYEHDEAGITTERAEVIAQMWKENLGITLGLRNTEWKVYLDEQRSLRYQVSRAGWIGDYVDPNTFLDMYVTDGGNNNTGFSNAEYDRLVQEAAKEADPVKREKILQRVEEILVVEQLPIMPIYFYVNQGLLAPKVKGFHQNIRDLHPFQFIYIGEEDEDEEE